MSCNTGYSGFDMDIKNIPLRDEMSYSRDRDRVFTGLFKYQDYIVEVFNGRITRYLNRSHCHYIHLYVDNYGQFKEKMNELSYANLEDTEHFNLCKKAGGYIAYMLTLRNFLEVW
jgi:hypothetical protein